MSSGTLCKLVRAAVVSVAVCGLVACAGILPAVGAGIAARNPGLANCYAPWLAFIWAAAAPCFAILALIWRVSYAIKSDRVFTDETARQVKTGAVILFADTGFFFLGNLALLLLNMSHFAVFFASLFADVFGVSLAVLAAVLSRYLTKAASLQEEADGTI